MLNASVVSRQIHQYLTMCMLASHQHGAVALYCRSLCLWFQFVYLLESLRCLTLWCYPICQEISSNKSNINECYRCGAGKIKLNFCPVYCSQAWFVSFMTCLDLVIKRKIKIEKKQIFSSSCVNNLKTTISEIYQLDNNRRAEYSCFNDKNSLGTNSFDLDLTRNWNKCNSISTFAIDGVHSSQLGHPLAWYWWACFIHHWR